MEEGESQEKRPKMRRRSIFKHSGSPSTDEPVSTVNGDDTLEKENKPEQETMSDKVKEKENTSISNTNAEEKTDEEGKGKEQPQKAGRKRKASEMKSDDSTSEEPPSKERALNPESEKPTTEASTADSELKPDELRGIEEANKNIKLPPKQSLGKGKRARIPNKRYSDFPLTPSRPRVTATDHVDHKASIQNGETKENIESESGSTSDLSGSRSSHTGSPATPGFKKSKAPVDLSNPEYLKPFQYGWKRELVYRSTSDNPNKRNGDIYYYTPAGKKVRSMREVAENLKEKNLTLDNFTFFKEPLGLNDPEKEIIRDAKYKSAAGVDRKSTAAPSPKTPKAAAVASNSPAASPVPPPPTTVKEAPPPPATPAPAEPTTPKPKKGAGGLKVKLPSSAKGKVTKAKQKKKEEELQMGTLPPTWQSPPKKSPAKEGNNDMDKRCRPCSIRCQGVSGPIPNLQCRICLCLYHNECVGLSPYIPVPNYVCKNCQLGQDENPAAASAVGPPPPLTPINSLKSVAAQPASTLPKLQRIPKQGETVPAKLAPKPPPLKPAPCSKPDVVTSSVDLPKLTPRPGISNNIPKATEAVLPVEPKSIVGSVTTWFPPSSTIQVNRDGDSTEAADASAVAAAVPPPPRPQFVEYLGNKKYLVIPKHNVVSVSPTIAASAMTPSSKPLNSVSNSEDGTFGFGDFNKTAAEAACAGPEAVLTSASLGVVLAEKTQTNDDLAIDIKTEPLSPINTESMTDLNDVNRPNDTDIPPSSDVPCEDHKSNEKDQEEALGGEDGKGRPGTTEEVAEAKQRATKRTTKPAQQIDTTKLPEKRFMDNFMQNLSFGYKTLLCVFQYLKVQDLLRASCVCKMWRDIASHPSLWHTVRMKNSQIHSFEGLADALQKHGTVHLDLRKMLLPGNGDEIWPEFSREIKKVDSLRKIELCRCPATVVEQLALSNPKLEVINAVTIKCESMGLAPLVYLKDLQELRLKSTAGFSLTSDLTALADLKQLKHLSLTSIKDLNKLNIDVIADLSNLISLELGECSDFPKTFGNDILSRLHKLEKLRLEKGQGNCHTFEILDAVKNMSQLEQLELVNFDIKPGFDKALGVCTNIKKLLIIPTYISQSATTNHMVLGGVLRLQSTLSHFVWGVTLELLRVTELFVDQCEDPEKKEKKEKRLVGNGDSIPVLKPVPLLKDGQTNVDIPPAQDPPQVEILPLPNLQKLLLQSLPTTRVKILKIPFHATWRQSITDTVN